MFVPFHITLRSVTDLPVVLFPTYDAPHYKYGYQVLILFGGLAILGTFILEWQQRHEK